MRRNSRNLETTFCYLAFVIIIRYHVAAHNNLYLNNGTEPDVVAVGRAPLIVCLKKSLATDGDANEGGRRLTNADGCYELVTSPQGDRR